MRAEQIDQARQAIAPLRERRVGFTPRCGMLQGEYALEVRR